MIELCDVLLAYNNVKIRRGSFCGMSSRISRGVEIKQTSVGSSPECQPTPANSKQAVKSGVMLSKRPGRSPARERLF
jgi:carbonic anhydrase/acetyltransferase-like protein (isoleucine patch superfamily)